MPSRATAGRGATYPRGHDDDGAMIEAGLWGFLGASFLIVGAVLAFVTDLSARVRGRSTLWDWLPAALLTASAGFACWCTGGLESMLFTFLCTLGLERVLAAKT